MARVRNIKIDFSGKNYDVSSLFQIGANGGVPSTSSVTYTQLTDSGAGFDMTISEQTNQISITASNGVCSGTVSTSSFNSYPFPSTSPLRLSSTLSTSPFSETIYGLTQLTGSCQDIYISAGTDVYRVHNVTGEVYPDKGPFDLITSSISYQGPLLYLPQYNAIACANNQGTLYPPNSSCLNIISMSGELLYQVDLNETITPQRNYNTLKFDGDRYLYADATVIGSGSTTVSGIKAGMFRVDLYSMSLDVDWTLNVAGGFRIGGVGLEPVDRFIIKSGSDDVVQWSGEDLVYISGSGDLIARLEVLQKSGGSYFDGNLDDVIKLQDDSYFIAGDFDRIVYNNSKIYDQSNFMRVGADFDFSPYTSSFSKYSIDVVTETGQMSLLEVPDKNYVIVATSVNTNNLFRVVNGISGSAQSTSGSIGYLDYTGSMIPFNYPTSAPIDTGIGVGSLRLQPDNSYYGFISPNAQYGGKSVGSILMISQSGIITDYV